MHRMELEDRVALITGGGGGIGEAIAATLAGEGAIPVVNDVDAARAAAVAGRIEARGHRALALPADVTRGDDVRRLIERAVDALGRIDILVNCAGASQTVMFEDIDEEDWRRIMDVNLTSTFLCCRAVIPLMTGRRRGKIINISTISAHRTAIFSGAHYVAAKTAVIGLTRQLAYELAPHGIQVNAVCPGTTFTPHLAARVPQERRDLLLKMIPAGRFATPQDHAYAVAFLASSKADFITGVALDVDGGALLSWMDYETYVAARRTGAGTVRPEDVPGR
ncbi:MAG: glucose 1-dehydrogenase [Armatimonadetes bacterium]|nr:glucose 1-dehydrogenase [Armatimonadota bacterium]